MHLSWYQVQHAFQLGVASVGRHVRLRFGASEETETEYVYLEKQSLGSACASLELIEVRITHGLQDTAGCFQLYTAP